MSKVLYHILLNVNSLVGKTNTIVNALFYSSQLNHVNNIFSKSSLILWTLFCPRLAPGLIEKYPSLTISYIFQGQFNYVNIVIKPLDYQSNAVTLQAKEGRLVMK